MARPRPSTTSLLIGAVLVAAITGWTVLVLTTGWVPALDDLLSRRPVNPLSATGQLASALALVLEPVLIYLAVLAAALWAFRNRMRALAGSLVIMVTLGYLGTWAFKDLVRRPRPVDAVRLLTTHGFAYPGGHVTAATIGVIAVTAILVVTRRPRSLQMRWNVAGAVILVLVGVDRWLVAADRVSDLIGGLLWGSAAAALSLLISGVTVIPPFVVPVPLTRAARKAAADTAASTRASASKRCAVVYNPARISDWVGFRRSLEYELRTRGWGQALWLETTVEDPGRGMARRAIDSGADLVIAAGGDGTVRVVAAELANAGVPFGIIPAGTGNLLAKNLGIPLDERAAMEVAFAGVTRSIDVVEVTIDDDRTEHFVVMAGIGVDASIIRSTNPELKRAVGSAAYFLSAARHANHPALHATITVDDHEPFRRRAHVLVIGNVGFLQGNIPLIPDAKPDDGLIDMLIASPRKPSDWVRLFARVMTRRDRNEDQLDRIIASRIRIEVAEGDNFELDGDPAGECHTMTAQILPRALPVRVPR